MGFCGPFSPHTLTLTLNQAATVTENRMVRPGRPLKEGPDAFVSFQYISIQYIQSSIFISYLRYISILCLHSKDFQKTLEISGDIGVVPAWNLMDW